jgi:tryptophanyl-tRNA synthetase
MELKKKGRSGDRENRKQYLVEISHFLPLSLSPIQFSAFLPFFIRFASNFILSEMETVVSGIRSTGNLHLGNYFGAIKNFLKMQKENNCYFFIADYHALTTHPKPDDLHGNIKQVLAEYLACGIDPEIATVFIQSDVPEVSELYLLLNMNAYVGELERTASFKEKIRKQPDNINAGLLTYPVLMAADIIIHRANKVPVGKDQEQHLEMTRKFARRFNMMYDVQYFPEPDAYNFGQQLVKIPGLDGTGKMGKSEGNGVFLADTPEEIRKKVMRAVTDTGPTAPGQKPSEAVENLFTIMKVVSAESTVNYFTDKYASCEIRYGDLKKQLAEDIIKFTDPIRSRISELLSDNKYLAGVVANGAEKARASASKTVREVREIIGYRPF